MMPTGLARETPPIVLYNTLTRAREPLHTERPDRVTMYVCGPTVYNFAHIGNARPAVVFDVLARLLRHDYARLVYARNFTDVDDKINAAAAASCLPIGASAARYIEAYQADMQALGGFIVPPDLEPRVTEHIPDIIALIQALIARGHAYVAQEHILFDVASWPDYGQLSGRRPEDMLAGARGGGRALQAKPARLRLVEAFDTGPARLEQSLGTRSPRMACGMFGDDWPPYQRHARHPWRRAGPDLPAP